MSDGISTIGSAAVTTVGTLAVTSMALKAVNNATKFAKPKGNTRKASNYKVFSGKKHSSKKSMLGF